MTIELPINPPDDAPTELAVLWPLVRRWSTGDDLARDRLLAAASDAELRDLSSRVRPLLPEINGYLDLTENSERSVPFGDLAQAAIDAEQTLNSRVV